MSTWSRAAKPKRATDPPFVTLNGGFFVSRPPLVYIFGQGLTRESENVGGPPHWMTVLLICAATFRLTRFVTRDAFPPIALARAWIQRKWDPFDDEGWVNYERYTGEERALLISGLKASGIPTPTTWRRSIAYLVTCTWCVSIWLGAVVTLFAVLTPSHWVSWAYAPLVWLTASAVTGLMSRLDGD